MVYLIMYVLSVVFVNIAFSMVPVVILPGGEAWPPVSLLVGFVFVIRDYAQREVGHWVLPAMLVGAALSWLMAAPQVAFASVCAFLAGELMDWVIYTFTGRPFSQRVLYSSAVSTPVDSAVFLGIMGFASLPSIALMTFSKMLGAFLIFWLARRRETLAGESA